MPSLATYRAICPWRNPLEVFTNNGKTFNSKEWCLYRQVKLQMYHFKHALSPIQQIHQKKCWHHQKCPQQSQIIQDSHVPGTHKALPNTYWSQPTKSHGDPSQLTRKTSYTWPEDPAPINLEKFWGTHKLPATAEKPQESRKIARIIQYQHTGEDILYISVVHQHL